MEHFARTAAISTLQRTCIKSHTLIPSMDWVSFAISDRILKLANDIHPYIHVSRRFLCDLYSGIVITSTADASFVECGHDSLVSIVSWPKVSLVDIKVFQARQLFLRSCGEACQGPVFVRHRCRGPNIDTTNCDSAASHC